VYDAFGAMLLMQFKKINKEELDKAKSGMDYDYINSFPYPAPVEDCEFFFM
jgi:hypothetical protein